VRTSAPDFQTFGLLAICAQFAMKRVRVFGSQWLSKIGE
jgi:hypothetical protein